ncbi:efflux RND transporter periplasmic adaptor subunit [Rhizobium sp. SGZ-381]|uniref:efflux RND transporter periplasmic adaptor subunit n=1 Tax=Rhizobium sp. SGZ-381 TaxID=3342800 RepID=UPI00366D9DD0
MNTPNRTPHPCVPPRDVSRDAALRSLFEEPVSPKPKPPARRLSLAALAMALAGAAAGLVLILQPPILPLRKPVPEPVPVAERPAAAVSTPPAAREITGSGFVTAPQKTLVFSRYEGQVVRVAVAAGDLVSAGDVLVVLDDATARSALDQAFLDRHKAELQAKAAALDLAQADASLSRIKTLALRDAATRQALEEAQTAMLKAENAVAQAHQSIDSANLAIRVAQERVDALTVRAPFAGTVTRLDAHVGDSVLARSDSVRESQNLLALTDMTDLVIDADVAERQIATLAPGLAGQAVLDGFPDRPFAVTVRRLSPVASAEKGTLSLRLSLTNPPAGIRPNMAARIRLFLNDTGDRLP